jgi:farnesyl diphosphate synthase
VDDVLDETSDAATLGKSPGKDRKSRKMSYPAAAGIEASRARARELADRAIAALDGVPDCELLAAIAELVVTRSA